MLNKFNEGQVHDFVGKTAVNRYLIAVGLSESAIPPDYSDVPISFDSEKVYFKSLHYIRYRWTKAIKNQFRMEFWDQTFFALRNKLVISYTPLIHDCIKKSTVRIGDYDDMFSMGSEALISAVEGFNPWRQFKFSTYACRSIFNRFSATARRDKNPLNCLDASEIDVPLPQEDRDMELYIERLKTAVTNAELTDSERNIIKLRFGDKKLTLREISATYGLSKERWRQIEKKALEKLRQYLQNDSILS